MNKVVGRLKIIITVELIGLLLLACGTQNTPKVKPGNKTLHTYSSVEHYSFNEKN